MKRGILVTPPIAQLKLEYQLIGINTTMLEYYTILLNQTEKNILIGRRAQANDNRRTHDPRSNLQTTSWPKLYLQFQPKRDTESTRANQFATAHRLAKWIFFYIHTYMHIYMCVLTVKIRPPRKDYTSALGRLYEWKFHYLFTFSLSLIIHYLYRLFLFFFNAFVSRCFVSILIITAESDKSGKREK